MQSTAEAAVTFVGGWRVTHHMSTNYRFYPQKTARKRTNRPSALSLSAQLEELLHFVSQCEARWSARGPLTMQD
jgi:hypothetical protein